MKDSEATWAVELWGSDPNAGNDDCWTAIPFATREEAAAFFANPAADKFPSYSTAHTTAWLALVFGSADHSTWTLFAAKPNPHYDGKRAERERKASDAEWRNEIRHQNMMGFGVDDY
jgi:hypothetical protein